jgi:hypothetical protein
VKKKEKQSRVMNYEHLFFAVLIVSTLMVIQNECRADDVYKEQTSAFGFRIDGGMKGSYWFTSDDDDSEEGVGHVLDYKPELVQVQTVQGEFTWKGTPWLQLYYENDLTRGGSEQDEVLEVSDKESSIEKINAFLDIFFWCGQSSNSTLNFISRIRLGYKHHMFFGKADVQEPSLYIDADSNVTALEPGDEIRFKSEFEEISINLRVSDNFWVGFYQSTTVKPHEASTLETQVLETEITGKGIKFLTEFDSFTFDANLGTVQFRADQDNFRSDGFETLFHFEWHPHIYLLGSAQSEKNNKHSLALIPLMGFQFSMQHGGDVKGQESDGTGELSMDIIVDAGIRLQYRF